MVVTEGIDAAPVVGPAGTRSTVGKLLEQLGPGVLEALVLPAGPLVPIGEPVIAGPGEPLPDQPGAVLLAAGAAAGAADVWTDLFQPAAARGFAAVVCKTFGPPDPGLLAAAARSGVALLRTPDDMSWRHLDALVAGAGSTDAAPVSFVGSGDLFALANAIAATVGGALTVEDPDGRVLAYSNLPHQLIDDIRRDAILGLQTPQRPQNLAEYRAVFDADGPVEFAGPHPGHASRLAVALWAGRRRLGILWVISDRPPLVDNATELLAGAARVAELHLLRLRGSHDPQRRRRTEALRELLELRAAAGGDRTGFAADQLVRILAIAPSDSAGRTAAAPARIVDVVSLLAESWDQRSLCVDIDGTVYAALPELAADRPDRLGRVRRLAADLVTTAHRSAEIAVVVAIGPVVRGASALPTSRHAADQVLRHLRHRARVTSSASGASPPDPVAIADDLPQLVALYTVAENLPDPEHLLLPAAASLLAADAAGGTPYADTVLTYLSTLGDMARTADLLTVHENTVRYRIRRAEELHGLDLTDPDRTLVTWLQLRLAQLK